MAKYIEIHATDPNGITSRLCALSGDNDSIMGAAPATRPPLRERLLAIASRMVGQWQEVFPHDRIFITEVDDPRQHYPETESRVPRAARLSGYRPR